MSGRFHPQSHFDKAWATHIKAAKLKRLSDEEKRVEYNRFCAEWEEKLRAADITMENMRAIARKSMEENEEIIRYNTQRIADLKEQGRLSDIKFAEGMKKYEDMFSFIKVKPRF
jgi:hypothetical protein